MPAFQTLLTRFNMAFTEDRIGELQRQRERFDPGQSLEGAVDIVAAHDAVLRRALKRYLKRTPPAIAEAIRAVIAQALSTSPATLITFAWAPAYDYEVTIWQAPDTRQTRGGVTLLFKSRYPDHAHPLARPSRSAD